VDDLGRVPRRAARIKSMSLKYATKGVRTLFVAACFFEGDDQKTHHLGPKMKDGLKEGRDANRWLYGRTRCK